MGKGFLTMSFLDSIFKSSKKKQKKDYSKEKNDLETKERIAANSGVIDDSVSSSIRAANRIFSKSKQYDRRSYQDPSAMNSAKNSAFKNSQTVNEPYTGKTMVKDQATAKERYGKNWQEHVAETDHKVPLHNIHEKHKGDLWNRQEDLQTAANSEENLEVVSRKTNNAKRDRTNEEFVEDTEYLKKTGVKLSKRGKETAKEHASEAETAIERQLFISQAKNIMYTAHIAGLDAAQCASSMTVTLSTFNNLIAVIRGEKDADTAFKDILNDTGKAAATGYVLGGGLTVLNRTLTSASSSFVKYLGRSNVAGTIVAAVTSMGDTLEKYDRGEISTDTCLKSMGEISTNLYSMKASMAIGQSLIPVPVVGAAIGAMVGTSVIHFLMSNLYLNDALIQRNKQIREQHQKMIAEELRYQNELRGYIDQYFTECQDAFNFVFNNIQSAWDRGDADGLAKAANIGIKMMGGETMTALETDKGFDDFLSSDEVLKL